MLKANCKYSPSEVAEYYNKMTPQVIDKINLQDTLQGNRAENIYDTFEHIIYEIGIQENMTLLDAGCGIGGPSIYIAKNNNVSIQGINISDVQVNMFEKKIIENNLSNKIKVVQGDFHFLDQYFPKSHFDAIFFLESLGHSYNAEMVIESAKKVLKKGGMLFIKDLFKISSLNPYKQSLIKYAIKQSENHY